MLVAISEIISSRDRPDPDVARGWIESIVSSKERISFYAVVISAFSWRPNASGEGFKGNYLMYVK